MRVAKRSRGRKDGHLYLEGQLLVAMPVMTDRRFARAVIYICVPSAEGAMGLIINQRAPNIRFPELLRRLSIAPSAVEDEATDLEVQVGGPVDTERGFVLHSADYYAADSTLPIDDSVSLTATIDILRAIAKGEGPHRARRARGH